MEAHASRAVCCVLSIIVSTVILSVFGKSELELFKYLLCDNLPVCLADEPSYSFHATSEVECGTVCQRQKTQPQYCIGVNYRPRKNVCDVFHNTVNSSLTPTDFRKNSTGCQFIQRGRDRVRCQDIPAIPIGVSYRNCSFPFTLNGKLYYQCAVNTGVSYLLGCFLMNLTQWVSCAVDSVDFVAQNSTVDANVTTSTGFTIIPLRSVNGWLAILSRVNSNFPYNQTYTTYQLGFGNITSNFLLGLDNIYQLTNPAANGGLQYRLRFEMLTLVGNKWYSIEYDYFYLESSVSQYVFRAAPNGIGDVLDALNKAHSPATNQPFVTSGYCVTHKGFWWYMHPVDKCGHARFFGHDPAWETIGTVKIVRMMVKQIN